MPSTYNNNLRLEMIGTGEQSGTWGQTTNTNLGTLIVDAITGKTSVTSSLSPYTLTALNGTADQSRAAVLELNCTGANFQVIVPTVTKLYVVDNVNAADSVTVKTASGSGVTVPPLKSVLVRCDGTNVVEQLDYIAGAFEVNGAATFGSTVTLDADPTLALQAATKQYVDSTVASGVPTGVIVMWSGTIATIPAGWGLCDGTGGTPDLRNRFIVGAHSDDAGVAKTTITGSATQTGGSKDAVVVSHTHTANVTDPGHNHSYTTYPTRSAQGTLSGFADYANRFTTNTGSSFTGISVGVSTEGSSGTNANLVPYYALAYIMKL